MSSSPPTSEWLHEYLICLQEFPRLDDTWFPEALARARNGDQKARKLILGSSLRLVVEVADELLLGHSQDAPSLLLHGLIETGNSFLEDCLFRFTGENSESYCSEVRAALRTRMVEEQK